MSTSNPRTIPAYVDAGDGAYRRGEVQVSGYRHERRSKDVIVEVGGVRISLRPQRAIALADALVDTLEQL